MCRVVVSLFLYAVPRLGSRLVWGTRTPELVQCRPFHPRNGLQSSSIDERSCVPTSAVVLPECGVLLECLATSCECRSVTRVLGAT